MASLELILLLLAVSAALLVPARRWGLPHPVLLVLGGAVLAVIPGLPDVTFDPEVAFVMFVPPLLYRTAITGSVRDFRSELWAILRLGVLLVLVTIGVVAWTAHALTPEFTWGAAFTLAAIVAPPDPVAATAVMRNLDAPGALVSILEGEGLVNDATALVSYRMAVAAVVTGSFSALHAAGGLLLTGAGGIAVGLIVAKVIVWVRRFAREIPSVENTVSVLTPFVAYLPADRLGASGVLSVVACGIYLSRVAPRVVPPATRVQSEAMWSMLNAWLEGLVFILIGLELPHAYRALHEHSLGRLLAWSAIVSGVMIVLRLAWVWPSAYIPRLFTRRPGPDGKRDRPLPSWRWVLTVGWAGMRGGDSLVIALALPLVTARGTPFPARDLITFLTFGAIFSTLVVQGLTLRPFLRWIGIHEDTLGEREELHARRVAAEAGLRRLDEAAARDGADASVVRQLQRLHERRLQHLVVRDDAATQAARGRRSSSAGAGRAAAHEAESYRDLRRTMLDAERDALVELRDRDEIGDDVLRRVQRDLDLETMMLDGGDEDAPESPYEAG